jgi:2,4-dienoyl-CoA reductase-like NADH-dependent reductase (Old Yellow Enzyme family)
MYLINLHHRRRYGGSFENRVRFLLETTDAIRTVWPASKPLFVRLSCTDWHEDGWKSEDTVKLAGLLKERGVDLMDCSTGGTVPGVKYPVGPGYQVPFSTAVKKAHQTSILTGSVGLITTPDQAEQILQNGDADLVFLGRQFLRDPYWTMKAGNALGVHLDFQPQYSWAVGRTSGIP